MDWQSRLIGLYMYLDEEYHTYLWPFCQRLTKNQALPSFSDVEVLTLYFFGLMMGFKELKNIHLFAKQMLRDWFPDLVSYPSFNRRLNRIHGVFPLLIERLESQIRTKTSLCNEYIVDSFPVIMAIHRRGDTAKVAPQLANKGLCASKNMYFHGLKMHVVAQRRKDLMPLPVCISMNPASHNDLTVIKQLLPQFRNTALYGDKIYCHEPLQRQLREDQQLQFFTPAKKKKNQTTDLTMFQKLYSRSVSKTRQPIESLFNWINQKTGIQNASKVRSSPGLMVHAFGRIAAAMYIMAFSM